MNLLKKIVESGTTYTKKLKIAKLILTSQSSVKTLLYFFLFLQSGFK